MSDERHGDQSGRLESRRERQQAERRYVAALEALDVAAELPPALTSSAAASDADHARLNHIWHNYSPAGADRAGGTFARIVAELARLLPWRRRALHGAMIAAINRQAEVTRALIDATRHFQSHVIWYGQAVAPFAATHRRGPAGAEDAEAVNAALNALAADWLRHRDAWQARDQRFDARMVALSRAYEELRDVANLAQQDTVALRKAIETRRTPDAGAAAGPAGPARPTEPAGPQGPAGPDGPAHHYVAFEDRFRGSREEVRRRLADYVARFADASNVLDVGCGRGELLDLLRDAGVSARGIDINPEMVEACRARGLNADRADAVSFLASLPDQSLGGLIAVQVVEHLEPSSLVRLIELAHDKLKPGAPLVLETINVACWAAFFDSYLRDFTHVRPLHPDTLRYLVQVNGFPDAEIQYRAPIDAHDQLPSVRLPAPSPGREPDPSMVDLVAALNAHAERLNAQLFSHRDYAVIARR